MGMAVAPTAEAAAQPPAQSWARHPKHPGLRHRRAHHQGQKLKDVALKVYVERKLRPASSIRPCPSR